MNRRSLFGIALSLLLLSLTFGGDFEVTPGGQLTAWQWQSAQINLYEYARNSAWLQENDSTNWMIISTHSDNSWGDLRRFWDPYGEYRNALTFSGQKHISPTQTFYGAITYRYDYVSRMNQAIDIQPYALDPFVISDSTEGDFSFNGPTVHVVYGQQISSRLWWGMGLDYGIYRGLKKVYSMPEIIRRKIKLDVSLAYQLNSHFTFGLSVRPYDTRDNTKIVKQPDGTEPLILRYRGEQVFTAVVSKSDRFAIYNGTEWQSQVMVEFSRLRGMLVLGYYYRWTEVYDNERLRLHDGFYQGEHYYVNTLWRYALNEQKNSFVTLGYRFRYIGDWAEEPVKKWAIYRSFQRRHQMRLGLFKTLHSSPFAVYADGVFDYWLPDRRDYLAHLYREASISNLQITAGGLWHVNPYFTLQAGVRFDQYRESAVWHYFGDFKSWGGECKASYRYGAKLFQVYLRYGKEQSSVSDFTRNGVIFGVRLKQTL